MRNLSNKLFKLFRFPPRVPGGKGKSSALKRANPPAPKVTADKELTFAVAPRLWLTLQARTIIAPIIGLFLYVLAALLANDWVYLLAIALFLSTVMGLWLPFLLVSSLKVSVHMPASIVSGQDTELSMSVKSGLPNWLAWLIPGRLIRLKAALRRRTIYSGSRQLLPAEPVLIEDLRQGGDVTFPLTNCRRGVYHLETLEVSSSYPFGLAWWTKVLTEHDQGSHMTVYPQLYSLSGNFLTNLRGMASSMGDSTLELVTIHQSSSVRGVREFRMGDSIRHIHWPSTARAATPIVREYDCETLPSFDLFLDLKASWKSPEQFELAVSLANALIQLGYNRDMSPEFHLYPGEEDLELLPLLYDMPQTPPGPDRYLEILARLEPLPHSPERLHSIASKAHRSDRVLLALIPEQTAVFPEGTLSEANQPLFPVSLTIAGSGVLHMDAAQKEFVVASLKGEEEMLHL